MPFANDSGQYVLVGSPFQYKIGIGKRIFTRFLFNSYEFPLIFRFWTILLRWDEGCNEEGCLYFLRHVLGRFQCLCQCLSCIKKIRKMKILGNIRIESHFHIVCFFFLILERWYSRIKKKKKRDLRLEFHKNKSVSRFL